MEQLIKAKEFLNSKGIATAVIGRVLGTGLHQLLNYVDVKQTISYADIPGFTLIGKTICCIV
jgi:purine-nucleoside phosphorylase